MYLGELSKLKSSVRKRKGRGFKGLTEIVLINVLLVKQKIYIQTIHFYYLPTKLLILINKACETCLCKTCLQYTFIAVTYLSLKYSESTDARSNEPFESIDEDAPHIEGPQKCESFDFCFDFFILKVQFFKFKYIM